ncbi:MAG: ornithine cyclodeaminase family protein [Sulfolobaceae archaeon]|nr:ornithine cyclodeaminase family protein [Sulfolobaceae archaeon]
MLVLNREDLLKLLDVKVAVNSMKEAFYKFYTKDIVQSPRQVLTIKSNWWGIMPAFQNKGFTLKIVNVINENVKRGLPTIQGIVILMSVDDGRPLAIIEGSTLTAIRTAATSLLSTELALGSNKKIETLGVIGAGTEAYYHILMARQYFKIDRILITARKSHVELAKKLNVEAVDITTLLRESNVIFTTTSSNTPVVFGSLLREDFHVVSIGAHTPNARELDDDVIVRAKTIFADHLEAVKSESGDFIIPESKGLFKDKRLYSLGEIIAEGLKVERPSVFKSVGIPAQDNAIAITLYEEALKRGIGKVIEF